MSSIKKTIFFPIAKFWFFIGLIVGCVFFPTLLLMSFHLHQTIALFIGGLLLLIIFPLLLLYFTSPSKETGIYNKISLKYQMGISEAQKAGVVYDIVVVEKRQLERYIDDVLRD